MVLAKTVKILGGLLLAVCLSATVHAQSYTLKFATLMPADTAWMKLLDEWAQQVERESKGRLKFKIYPGGVMGDEPDVIRKMRSNQLHGGAFTGYGIGHMYSPARVLEVPFLFQNVDESDYVRDQLMPSITQGFHDSGYELLGWMEVGFIHFFSKHPIRSIEDLKQRRIWLWQGDPLGEAFFKAGDLSPIPLSIIDVYPQLSTSHGVVDTVYISPFGALAMQWHSKVKYVTNIPMTNAIAGLVVSRRFFDALPADLQSLLRRTGKETGRRIIEITRRDNEKSIELLKQSGLKFMWNWEDVDHKEVYDLRDRAARHLADTRYIPYEYFERTRKLLEQYRKEHGGNRSSETGGVVAAPEHAAGN